MSKDVVDCGSLDDNRANADWLRRMNASASDSYRSGYRACPARGRHWGPRGAAGVIPWAVWAGRVVVLLGKRGPDVQDPGTWSSFGGAIDEEENSEDTALRELAEEIRGVTVELAHPPHIALCAACGWAYSTYLGRSELDKGRLPLVTIRNWETTDAWWVLSDQVTQLDLHPGLAKAWPALRASFAAAAGGKVRV